LGKRGNCETEEYEKNGEAITHRSELLYAG